ncbi:hypothetical protein ABIA32_003273 [Streptacidiphilus sp. MAP12-20]|uniref:hypothetical protein n=1 Tax=Streptacidiphilus sp. MAP12-20 TaxID=3156299 RepID=UPI0035115E67
MTTTHATPHALSAAPAHAALGAAAGLAGGIVFGVKMQAMGMISMVGMLVHSNSTAVAWTVHLAVSAALGAGFALLAGGRAEKLRPAALLGMGYGAVWWVLGALWLMPARLGMPVFQLTATSGKSLVGHLMYGAVLGLAYAGVHRAMCRTRHSR